MGRLQSTAAEFWSVSQTWANRKQWHETLPCAEDDLLVSRQVVNLSVIFELDAGGNEFLVLSNPRTDAPDWSSDNDRQILAVLVGKIVRLRLEGQYI